MKALKAGLGLLAATIAVFAVPLAAQAEYLVPPGNSAATQYTEAVPTAGGPKAGEGPKHDQARPPSKVLGSANVKRLDEQGPQGHAAAEVAAATAPSTLAIVEPHAPQRGEGRPTGQGGTSTGPASGEAPSQPADGGVASTPSRHGDANGSSGLGEVLGQATGSSSSGQLGLLLPLIVLATIAWAVAFVLRQRKRSAA